MPAAPRDVHVLLDTHPAHPSAVTAHLTGTQHLLAQPLLSDRGFEPLNEHTMVLARIDHDEPYQTNEAVQELTDAGITTEVTPRLREAIHNEWTWDDHPLSWQTDHQLRQLHTEAQQIHDDIRHGHLIVHAHAQDDEGTTMAVATYRVTGKSVHLYGEDHLRGPSGTFDSIADALTAFERAFGDTLRPGPAPMTDTERQTAHARTSLQAPSTPPTATVPVTEEVPAYAADPADHNVLLGSFVSEHGDWERWRTWSDETTHVIHESQTLRIELVHEAHPRDTAWTVAAYETPVSDRMWHLTATAATPAPVLEELLNHLAVGDGWDTNVAATVDEKMVTAATQPLCDAGWKHNMEGRWIRWTSPDGDVGVQFDAFTAQHPTQNLATWTIWAGPNSDRHNWTITASPHTPTSLLADLSETLAHGVEPHQPQPQRHAARHIGTVNPALTANNTRAHGR